MVVNDDAIVMTLRSYVHIESAGVKAVRDHLESGGEPSPIGWYGVFIMDDVLEQVMELATECDFKVMTDAPEVTLVHDGLAIFKGSAQECLLYLRGWRDGRRQYLEHESRGAEE